ncbi:hypothetical protein H2200_007015 [Cladophialophora chaetospira]|uniref:Uncharacterized protein n=1 Tax=Cladophialophora chaetospira TaxID=386627 RepID=A0AA38X709_9EURO|nr:hypothetical protein H2200_007015 [Cladophialophora chaetospira]
MTTPRKGHWRPNAKGEKPAHPPEPYPRWERKLPEIPACIDNDQVNWVANFVNERLSRLHQVETRQAEAIGFNQQWTDKTSKKWETRIFFEILPAVLLGLRYLWNHIKREANFRTNDAEKVQFEQDTSELCKFYLDLREDKKARHLLKQYTWTDDLGGNCRSPWTELRGLVAYSALDKLRKQDRIGNPRKYLAYVMEAEPEWLLIKKFMKQ